MAGTNGIGRRGLMLSKWKSFSQYEPGVLVVVAISVVLLAAAPLVSVGFFSGDEAVYFMGAHAFWTSGEYAVQNGYEAFASDDLKLWLLIDGPSGLVPQYPVGTALLGAVLIPVFGQGALVALNLLAAIGTLFVTYVLGRRLFDSVQVATLSVILLAFFSFWSEYAFGHWPHSVSVFFTLWAFLLFLAALDREDRAWLPACWSGFVIGAGLLFRLDGVLILPAIAAATILLSIRPLQILAGGAAGLMPALAFLSFTNHNKFGTWNPISYGTQGGGADFASHIGIGIALLLVLVGMVALRHFGGALGRHSRLGGIALISGAVVILLSPIAPALLKILAGFHALVLDATAIVDPRPGITALPDGSVLFYGIPKKALGQSLPWLGILTLLVGIAWDEKRRSIIILLLVVIIWMAPFLPSGWHGGLSSNMRYFLPTIPLLAILCAWLVLRLADRAGQRAVGLRFVLLGLLFGLTLPILWPLIEPGHEAFLHQRVASITLFVIAGTTLLAGVLSQKPPVCIALVCVGFGFGISAFLSASDLATSQFQRSSAMMHSTANQMLPDRLVIYGFAEHYGGVITNPEQFLALPDRMTNAVDLGLIKAACAADFQVAMPPELALGVPALEERVVALETSNGTQEPALIAIACE